MANKEKKIYDQIMTKKEMSAEEAETIIDDMYQDKYKVMEQKTEQGVIIEIGRMDEITFTNLEFASVRILREIQSLRHENEQQEKEIVNLKSYLAERCLISNFIRWKKHSKT